MVKFVRLSLLDTNWSLVHFLNPAQYPVPTFQGSEVTWLYFSLNLIKSCCAGVLLINELTKQSPWEGVKHWCMCAIWIIIDTNVGSRGRRGELWYLPSTQKIAPLLSLCQIISSFISVSSGKLILAITCLIISVRHPFIIRVFVCDSVSLQFLKYWRYLVQCCNQREIILCPLFSSCTHRTPTRILIKFRNYCRRRFVRRNLIIFAHWFVFYYQLNNPAVAAVCTVIIN